MAENVPNLPGSVPPKPAEAKVQPKKETVRITLPPKPTAAPTIKLPSLPPSQVSSSAGAPPAPPPPAQMSGQAPPPSSTGGPRLSTMPGPKPSSAAAPASRLSSSTGGSRPASTTHAAAAPAGSGAMSHPAPAIQRVSVFDKVLAVAAMLTSLAAVGTVVYLMMLFKPPGE